MRKHVAQSELNFKKPKAKPKTKPEHKPAYPAGNYAVVIKPGTPPVTATFIADNAVWLFGGYFMAGDMRHEVNLVQVIPQLQKKS